MKDRINSRMGHAILKALLLSVAVGFIIASLVPTDVTGATYNPVGRWVISTNVNTTTNEAVPSLRPGALIWDAGNGIVYEYVQYDDGAAVTATAGDPAYIMTSASYVVTGDISGSVTTYAQSIAGIFVNSPTDQYYTLIQVLGPYATVTTNGDDDIAQGDWIIGNADVVVDSVASGSAPGYRVLGVATADDVNANNTVATLITVGPF
jgi:hypothetical protein